jgi:hypothetical protein
MFVFVVLPLWDALGGILTDRYTSLVTLKDLTPWWWLQLGSRNMSEWSDINKLIEELISAFYWSLSSLYVFFCVKRGWAHFIYVLVYSVFFLKAITKLKIREEQRSERAWSVTLVDTVQLVKTKMICTELVRIFVSFRKKFKYSPSKFSYLWSTFSTFVFRMSPP